MFLLVVFVISCMSVTYVGAMAYVVMEEIEHNRLRHNGTF